MKKMMMVKKRGQEKLRRETEVLLCIKLPGYQLILCLKVVTTFFLFMVTERRTDTDFVASSTLERYTIVLPEIWPQF